MACKDKRPIEIVRGTSNSFGIELMNGDGNPYTLAEGQSLVFGLKRNERDSETIFKKIISEYINEAYYLEISPADTMELDVGQYYYDVGLQEGDSDFYNVIECSPFRITPNVTKLGDGA